MDYDLIVVKTLERVYKNYYYIIRGEMNMAEDFGDSTGSGLVNTAGQAAKEVVQAVVTKGASIGGKGGGGISLSGEAKDMMAASKQLAGGSAAPSREHLVAKPDLSR